ncbi:MAG: glycoside hydrolase family 2 protein [Clostridia bacterium]|nr:glycoside hydrolase family 2 protein [Clostridia bacterium]
MTTRIPLNFGWEFTSSFDESFLAGKGSFDPVDLPHCGVATPFHYFSEEIYQMRAGYRRTIPVPEALAGKRLLLTVGGAAQRVTVWVNGEKAAVHACGYTALTVELTPFVTPGRDLLLVLEVDSRENLDQPPFGYVVDYLTYAGLYREVTLEVREESFLADVFVMPALPEDVALPENAAMEDAAGTRFTGRVTCRVTCDGNKGTLLRQRVLDQETVIVEGEFAPGKETSLSVPEAKLWDPLSPALYTLETELWDGNTLLDRNRTRFGFRRAVFQKDGFFLNGRRFLLRGLNRHQSWPYVGYAMPASQQRLDADILKMELGVNAVRTSHYPQSHAFIDRCDELGLLVFTEIPGWQHIGGAEWQAQAVRNTEDMVRQYRNHPSIILWGVRINESEDDDALYEKTNAAARREDPTRATGGVRKHKKGAFQEDVYTYNDFSHDGKAPGCEPKKAVTPDMNRAYLISEFNGHMFPTKSWDDEAHRLEHALRHARVLNSVAAAGDIAGCFGWCAFDYNTHKDFGAGDHICYHGVADMFRNSKLAGAVYASQGSEKPVLAISSAMNIGDHPEGITGTVYAFTNADEVRFYKNDTLIRTFTRADSPFHALPHGPIAIHDLIGDQLKEEGFAPRQERYVKSLLNYTALHGFKNLPFKILFRAAWLMLRYRMTFDDAYALFGKYCGNWGTAGLRYRFEAVRDGKAVKCVTVEPLAEPHLTVTPDRTDLSEGETFEVVSLRARVTDKNGNTLPYYNGEAEVTVSGPLVPYGNRRCLIRGGTGGVYLRTTGQTGPVQVTLSLPDADAVQVDLTVR